MIYPLFEGIKTRLTAVSALKGVLLKDPDLSLGTRTESPAAYVSFPAVQMQTLPEHLQTGQAQADVTLVYMSHASKQGDLSLGLQKAETLAAKIHQRLQSFALPPDEDGYVPFAPLDRTAYQLSRSDTFLRLTQSYQTILYPTTGRVISSFNPKLKINT